MKPALIILIFLFTGVLHAQTITVSIEGTKQGKFKGESIKGKFSGKTELAGFYSEMNAASGTVAGRRSWMPVTLLKAVGASSPQFVSAAMMNELLKTVVIDFYKTDQNGLEVIAYSITLENASISGIKQYAGPVENEKFNPANNTLFEEIKISFGKITVEDKIAKTAASDILR